MEAREGDNHRDTNGVTNCRYLCRDCAEKIKEYPLVPYFKGANCASCGVYLVPLTRRAFAGPE
jgi:hypothetical protein